MSRIAIVCFTRQGGETARRIAGCFLESPPIYGAKRAVRPGMQPFSNLLALIASLFPTVDGLIFVGACGIAVRAIAPHLRDKLHDPAVVVVDEVGQFAISLLSGHIGGGNQLANRIATGIGAVPVITTATDIQGKFAVDLFAKKNRLLWEDKALAKEVSAAVLAGEPVGLVSDYPVLGDQTLFAQGASLGILVSHHNTQPFPRTLWLRPKNLVLGIGCKKGVSKEQIRSSVTAALTKAGLSLDCAVQVRSIDQKRDEPGLLAFCGEIGCTPQFYSAQALRAVPGVFAGSAFVESTVGVDNVCERCAVLGGNALLVTKTAANGVTVAVAEQHITLEL